MGSKSPRSGARPAAAEDASTKKVAADAAHTLFIESTAVLFMIYRNTLAKPARLVIPDHTRNAIFQAFCDLRTNTPKDKKWLKRHLNALKPHTANGWLALAAALLLVVSGLTGLLCVVAALLTALLYFTVFLTAVAGIATGALLTALSLTTMAMAATAGTCALSIGGGYTSIEIASRTLSWVRTRIVGPATSRLNLQQQTAAHSDLNSFSQPDNSSSSDSDSLTDFSQLKERFEPQQDGNGLPTLSVLDPGYKQAPPTHSVHASNGFISSEQSAAKQ